MINTNSGIDGTEQFEKASFLFQIMCLKRKVKDHNFFFAPPGKITQTNRTNIAHLNSLLKNE
jgi:hypothetical protein